jgi:hypothetical protein
LIDEMAGQGFDPDLVHAVESISTIAFGRMYFEPHGITYSPTVILARRDGRIETGVPLMSIPAYSRARAVAARLRETMTKEDFQALCLYNAESHAILQAIEASGENFDLSSLTLFPSVVPDRGVSDQTMNEAIATLNALIERKRSSRKKPWWKFW